MVTQSLAIDMCFNKLGIWSWIAKSRRVQLYTTPAPQNKYHFKVICYQCKNVQNTRILQTIQNTTNTYKYNKCTMWYFLWILEVSYLVFCFKIEFSCSCFISVYVPILINVPIPFIFICINFCPKPYMPKSLTFIKFTIFKFESCLHMKDYCR